jgi:hypothetical protein
MMRIGSSIYNLLYILQLLSQTTTIPISYCLSTCSCEEERRERDVLLMFIRVQSWILEGSWFSL